MRDHPGRFDRWGTCRGCEEARRTEGAAAICRACESQAEAMAEARSGRWFR